MAGTKLYLVIKEDTVIQATGYLVRAHDETHAKECVEAGMFIEETKPQEMDVIESRTGDVTEISEEAIGQERK